jgi:hypothetical protein
MPVKSHSNHVRRRIDAADHRFANPPYWEPGASNNLPSTNSHRLSLGAMSPARRAETQQRERAGGQQGHRARFRHRLDGYRMTGNHEACRCGVVVVRPLIDILNCSPLWASWN